ncbi:MAG: hypothetical protein IKY52_07175 [Clostridia bacterium]|nr:hypothetical protein [Clostridia bacterium]
MKRSVLLLLGLCAGLCIALYTGCTRESPETLPPIDNDTSSSAEIIVPETPPSETEQAETEYAPPPTHTIPPAYNSIREYAASPDAPDFLRELTGLPDGFAEVLVETGGLHCITYANGEDTVAFFPLETETALEEYMAAQLAGSGTYEELLANDLVSDVHKTDLSAEEGILYECLYNTKTKTDLKLRYREYTAVGIRYVLSFSYDSSGSLQYWQMFAFDGDASFACSGSALFTDEEFSALRSIPLQ